MIIAFGGAWRANSAAATVVKAPKSYIAPAALDSLGRYLRPIALTSGRRPAEAAELFAREDYYAQPERAERRFAGPSARAGPAGPARPRWVVSAILLTDAQRMAVVNDSVVVVGSTLPGGARIVEILSDRVVLQESGGGRRIISLNR
ncbi:MAG: hypothetical protein H0W42_02725 [Gemmatimonadaceae bacterium]|nr:hypothetical protein [Gemmatimonadaceae bacterium]